MGKSWLDRAWSTLASMRFAIWLLVVLAAASLVNLFANEFIMQANGGPEAAAQLWRRIYGEPRASILLLLQMYAPYRSWWYTAMLGLLLLSLLTCVIDRTPKVWRDTFGARFLRDPRSYLEAGIRAELTGAADLAERITRVLRRSGYRVRCEEGEEITLLDGEKYAFSRGGSWLVHVGFIFLILGGAMIARGSYNIRAGGLPGDMLAPSEAQWGFNVRIDDFRIEYYPLGEGQLVLVDNQFIGRIVKSRPNGTFDLEMFQPTRRMLRAVAADRIRNHFESTMGNGRLDQPNISDYIATLTIVENGRDIRTERVEVNHPLRYKGYRFYQSSFDDRHVDEQGRWTTILNVRKDQGSPFVWFGLALVTFGLVLGMYIVPKQVAVRIEAGSDDRRALLVGRPARNPSLYQDEFNRLVEAMRADANARAEEKS